MNEGDAIITDLSERTLTWAIKANLYALFRYFGRSPYAEVCEDPGLIRWRTDVAHPWFSGVVSSAPPTGDEGKTIQEAVSYFRSHRAPYFTWWLAPDLALDPWARQLEPHGFHHDGNTPGMAVDLAALSGSVRQPAGLVIGHVETALQMQEWARTFAAGYGLSAPVIGPIHDLFSSLGLGLPYRYYLAYQGGKPVAASMLFLGAGAAGIYCVATLPEARGQGIGGAVTLAPLLEARDLGYRAGILQASDMGYGVYRRLGFKTYCAMDHFFWSA
jgi:GNAT superfamily N-acetyltransferase